MKKILLTIVIMMMMCSGAYAEKQPCTQPGCDDHDGDFTFNDDLAVGGEAKISGSLSIQETATSVLTGSIDPTASTAVTGVGTKFLSELVTGDKITVSGETNAVVAIASDTSLTVGFAFTDVANDTSPDRLPALFTGRDSDGTLKYVQYENSHIEQLASGFVGPGWDIPRSQNAWRATQIEHNTNGGRTEWGFGDGTSTPWSMRGAHTVANPAAPAVEIECWTWDGSVHVANLGAAYKCLTIGPGHDEKVVFYGGGKMTITTAADDSTGNTIAVTASSRIESGALRGISVSAINNPNVGASSTVTTGIEVTVNNGGDQNITGDMIGGDFLINTTGGSGTASAAIGLQVSATHNVGELTSYKGLVIKTPTDTGGTWVNNYGMYVETQNFATLTPTINAAFWIEPSLGGTANYGVVLDGDSTGADNANSGSCITLGDGQDDRICHNGTDLVLNPATAVDIQGELNVTGVTGSGKVVCVKADGDFGVCSDATAGDGTCTCG